MNKITILSTVLSLIFTISSNSANAGFFDWINQTNTAENNITLSANWDFNKAVHGFQDMISGKNEPSLTPEPKVELKLIKTHTVTATAYSSTPDQTDDTPFTTASGTTVRDGVVATNFLPFGTLIRIPDLFGNKIFVVEDRMNRRYTTRVDIWFPERELAKMFGVKTVKIEVVALATQN